MVLSHLHNGGPGCYPREFWNIFFKVQLSDAMSTNRLSSVSVEYGTVKRECCITEWLACWGNPFSAPPPFAATSVKISCDCFELTGLCDAKIAGTLLALLCRPYNLYCVGGGVKPCSVNQSVNVLLGL